MPYVTDEERNKQKRKVAALIGHRIREGRTKAGLSQVDLIERIGRSPSWISFIEGGQILCTIPDLIEIAAILDKPIEYFLSDANIISSFRAPQTPEEWRAMYPGEPDRATAHESIDRIYRDAQRVLTAQIRAGIGPAT